MKGFTFESVDEFNADRLLPVFLQKASQMEFGLDTESDGPLLISPQTKAATKTLPEATKYKDFIVMARSTTVGVSLAFEDKTAYYIPLNHRKGNAPFFQSQEMLRELLLRFGHKAAVHNLKHELTAFERLGITWEAKRYGNPTCTQVLAHATHHEAYGKSPLGLKSLSKKFLHHEMSNFETVVGGTGGSFGLLDPHDARAVEYACEDAVGALLLRKKFWPTLRSYGLESWFDRYEMPFVWVLNECESTGISLDKEKVQENYDWARPQTKEAKKAFQELTHCNPASSKDLQGLWEGVYEPVAAPIKGRAKEYQGPQRLLLASIFPTSLGEKEYYTTKAGGWSTQADHMEKMRGYLEPGSKGIKALDLLMEFREAAKVVSTYSKSLLRLAEQYPDGRIHPQYLQTGTATGRLASSYPNGQNQPSRGDLGKKLMSQYRAEPGCIWFGADYSQIDLRVLAHFSGGITQQAFQDKSRDPHQELADSVGITRDAAKTVMYLTVYGGGPGRLSSVLNISVDRAKQILSDFGDARPEVGQLMDRISERAMERGYIKSLSGRRRRFPRLKGHSMKKLWSMDKEERGKLMADLRRAGNFVPQGGAGDVVKKAMVDFYFIKDDHVRFQTQTHDDIRCEFRGYTEDYFGAERVRAAMAELQDCMENAWKLEVPLIAEPVCGFSWLDLKGGECILNRKESK